MRCFMIANMRRLLLLLACARAAIAAQPIILDQTHESRCSARRATTASFFRPITKLPGSATPSSTGSTAGASVITSRLPATLEGVRTRLVVDTEDFIRFYHARMNAIATRTIGHGGSGWPMRFSPIFAGRSQLGTMPETLHKLENRRRGDNHGN